MVGLVSVLVTRSLSIDDESIILIAQEEIQKVINKTIILIGCESLKLIKKSYLTIFNNLSLPFADEQTLTYRSSARSCHD